MYMEDKKRLKSRRVRWFVWLLILVLSAYIVPYLFLEDTNKATGSFFFWTAFAITAIISTFKIIGMWRD